MTDIQGRARSLIGTTDYATAAKLADELQNVVNDSKNSLMTTVGDIVASLVTIKKQHLPTAGPTEPASPAPAPPAATPSAL